MLEPTGRPGVYRFRVQGPGQPPETGHGIRTVIVCTLELPPRVAGGIIRYLHHDTYQRETPSLPWRHVAAHIAPLTDVLVHLIRAAAVEAVITHISPLDVIHNTQEVEE